MNVVGLNDLMLRSMTTSYAWDAWTAGARVYLFKGEVPESLSDLPFSLTTSTRDEAHTVISEKCSAVAGALLSVNRDQTNKKIQLLLNNASANIFNRDRGTSFKANPALVYGGSALGDCFLHYVNNYNTATSKGSGPTIAAPAVLPWKDVFPIGIGQSKDILASKLASGAVLNLYIGLKGDSAPSSSGVAVVNFDEAVWSDFIIFNMTFSGSSSSSRGINHVAVLNEANVWENIQTGFGIGPNQMNRINFTRRKIRAVRLSTNYETQGFVTGQFWLNRFTAGLSNYGDLPEFTTNLTTANDPFTWAIVQPETDSVDRNASSRRPVMLCTVGASGSDADLKMTAPTYNLLGATPFVSNQVLLQLDY